MYELLERLATRPEPYSLTTIKELWTRPHVARQMLAYHLDQDTYLASRPISVIEEIVDWLDQELHLAEKRICDLGCGPGLYALRMAERGVNVIGVDFSPTAIDHAEYQASTTKTRTEYRVADYLHDDLPGGFDVVTLIYYDYCALSPADRCTLLRRMHSMLNPGGSLVMDVVADNAFHETDEQLAIEERLMNGFWSESDYVGVHRTWVYSEQRLSLDHYAIVEPSDCWEILNWMQYFSPAQLVKELEEAGFAIRTLTGSLTGEALTDGSNEIGVIADKCHGGERG